MPRLSAEGNLKCQNGISSWGGDGCDPSVYDTETKAGAVMAAKTETDIWFEDVASFYQETNDVGQANYVQMPYVSKFVRGNDGAAASYTIEMFYKTRSTVRGTTSNRQVLVKFGGTPFAGVFFDALTSRLLFVDRTGGTSHYTTSTTTDVDDGRWHHVAVAVDGAAETNNICFYLDYRLEYAATGAQPDVATGNSIFFGAKERGEGQWFDGWIDDIRLTRRALEPNEFLTTHPVGTGDASMLALFEQNYDFTCASNETFNVTGTGEARTGGNAPTFVKESRGDLILDGTNGTERVVNEWSASFDRSRVVLPACPFLELDAYTVEFWAKFNGIVEASGPVAADSKTLTQHAPIMRIVR